MALCQKPCICYEPRHLRYDLASDLRSDGALRRSADHYLDPGWSEVNSESFQTYARSAAFGSGNDAIVLDAGKLVVDQTGKSMIGMFGARAATHADFPGAELLRSTKEAIRRMFEAKEATSLKEKLKLGGGKGTPEMVGLEISLMPLRGGKSTGMKAVRVCDLSIWAQTYLNATR